MNIKEIRTATVNKLVKIKVYWYIKWGTKIISQHVVQLALKIKDKRINITKYCEEVEQPLMSCQQTQKNFG